MSSFKLPKIVEEKINSVYKTTPRCAFVNNGTYYANLAPYWINYMQNVVRECVAYGTGTVDGANNNLLSSGAGQAVINGAARLIRGERYTFDGDDAACRFLSDVWTKASGFDIFLERNIRFMLLCGTAPFKIDIDAYGRASLSTYRLDRSLISTDDKGDVIEAVFYVSLLSSQKTQAGDRDEYWLVEHRLYDRDFKPCVKYKVFHKSGIAAAPVLPDPYTSGISFYHCPGNVKRELLRMGITELNFEYALPFSDGLGVYQTLRTACNSCIPDAFLGDPLLYGVTNLLWSLDVVFSGSVIDIVNGKGKVLVPKQFLSQITTALKQSNVKITTQELDEYGDDSFVYIQPSMFDKSKDTPTSVQFEIRADQYKSMWELYEREMAVRVGFSPTSLFPHLVPAGSQKTATEVNAEENLTRNSVQTVHSLIIPVYERALKEILRLEGYSDDISMKLSDYIGNKIVRDQNIRNNVEAGLIPKEDAVQIINGLSASETQEYMEKLQNQDIGAAQRAFFDDKNYYGEN